MGTPSICLLQESNRQIVKPVYAGLRLGFTLLVTVGHEDKDSSRYLFFAMRIFRLFMNFAAV